MRALLHLLLGLVLTFAALAGRARIANDWLEPATFDLDQTIHGPDGRTVATKSLRGLAVAPGESQEFPATMPVNRPRLRPPEDPALHKLVTVVRSGGADVDAKAEKRRCRSSTASVRSGTTEPFRGS